MGFQTHPTNKTPPLTPSDIYMDIGEQDGGGASNSNGIYRTGHVFSYQNSTSEVIELYECPSAASVLSVSEDHPHTNIKPFKQWITLSGPGPNSITVKAQVDDGATRNCIGRHIWQQSSPTLGSLATIPLRLSVANNQVIPCDGLWYGEVTIGQVKMTTYFVVFDCQGAFDVILGKPWLVETGAHHDYKTNTITIPCDWGVEVIKNSEIEGGTQRADINEEESETDDEMVTPSVDLDELLAVEVLQVEMIHKANLSVESRYAKYLEVEEMEDAESPPHDPDTGLLWYTTKEEQRKINKERKQEQKER